MVADERSAASVRTPIVVDLRVDERRLGIVSDDDCCSEAVGDVSLNRAVLAHQLGVV